jgi:hypothetical protein
LASENAGADLKFFNKPPTYETKVPHDVTFVTMGKCQILRQTDSELAGRQKLILYSGLAEFLAIGEHWILVSEGYNNENKVS